VKDDFGSFKPHRKAFIANLSTIFISCINLIIAAYFFGRRGMQGC